jgi:hypothetical protein
MLYKCKHINQYYLFMKLILYMPDFSEIYDLKANTPDDLKFLLDKIESIGFERRSNLLEGMMKELIRRINL